jgi:hypothetical protein
VGTTSAKMIGDTLYVGAKAGAVYSEGLLLQLFDEV